VSPTLRSNRPRLPETMTCLPTRRRSTNTSWIVTPRRWIIYADAGFGIRNSSTSSASGMLPEAACVRTCYLSAAIGFISRDARPGQSARA
jgi:hypothetical protein